MVTITEPSYLILASMEILVKFFQCFTNNKTFIFDLRVTLFGGDKAFGVSSNLL